MDRLIINDIVSYAYHGVLPGEQELGQEFRTSVELAIDLSGLSGDRLEEVADYRTIVAIVQDLMQNQRCRLLETLACRIAGRLAALPGVLQATVRVQKPHPPLSGIQGGVAVEVSRRNKEH